MSENYWNSKGSQRASFCAMCCSVIEVFAINKTENCIKYKKIELYTDTVYIDNRSR